MINELLEKFKENYFAGDYDTPALIVLDDHVSQYGLEALVDIAIANNRDTVAVKRKGDIYGVRFLNKVFSKDIKPGDYISRYGNTMTTLGEGLYMYCMDSEVLSGDLNINADCLYLYGENVEYLQILEYNDGYKGDELLVLPQYNTNVLDVITTNQEFKNYKFNKGIQSNE